MAAEVDIYNRALQKLGAKLVTSTSENSVNARACSAAYASVRDALYRKHVWAFTIERAELAADATEPEWGRANSFTLPSDFIRLAPKYPEDNSHLDDNVIEGRKILTNDAAPIYIRYVKRVTDVETMDVLFRELLSTELAFELCEALTQSNQKKEGLRSDAKDIIKEAKRANAIESVAQEPPADPWLTARA